MNTVRKTVEDYRPVLDMRQHERCYFLAVFDIIALPYPCIKLLVQICQLDFSSVQRNLWLILRLVSFTDNDPIAIFQSCEGIGSCELLAFQVNLKMPYFYRERKRDDLSFFS